MNVKVFSWLVLNINKYDCEGEEALRIKSAISQSRVMGDSEGNLHPQLQGMYDNFCSMFYNNVFGYANGLADNPITASELDCYFISSPEGIVPIGYFKLAYPETAKDDIEKFITSCKENVTSEINQVAFEWDNSAVEISRGLNSVHNSKKPSKFKAVLGIVVSLVTIVVAIFSLIQLNVVDVLFVWGDMEVLAEAMYNIPFLVNGGHGLWLIYFLMVIVAVILAIIGLVFVVKEFKLLTAKKTSATTLSSVKGYMAKMRTDISNSVETFYNPVIGAVKNGINYQFHENENSNFVSDVDTAIDDAKSFILLPDKKRVGISYILIIVMIILNLLVPVTYIDGLTLPFGDSADTEFNNDYLNGIDLSGMSKEEILAMYKDSGININNGNSIGIIGGNEIGNNSDVPQKPSVIPVPDPEPEVSEYFVYKSNASWTTASANARYDGGTLACINTYAEFMEVCALAEENGLSVFWVGASRGAYEDWDSVRWQDGESLDPYVVDWHNGKPSYYDGEIEECYLMVFKVKGQWKFNDAQNDVSEYYKGRMGYIVEVKN